MNISIATVFKELYAPFLQTSLIKRAQENKHISFDVLNLFDCVKPKERIDAPSFGPGAGMVLKPKVIQSAIEQLEVKHGSSYKIFFSPKGKVLTQPLLHSILQKASQRGHLMLLPARYEGMDSRVEEKYADEIVSVGDYVLMGGDIPAMLLLEGMLRLIPGVVGNQSSVQEDSFSGPFVDYPEYTEPVEWEGMNVPEIVRSGNHAAIAEWRYNQAAQATITDHFEWFRQSPLTETQKMLGARYVPRHYTALLHDQVLIGPDRQVGTTSVMSIDIHDIARSSCTYGVEKFFVVTPLQDQQDIVSHFLSFWQKGEGVTYNKTRHEALGRVALKSSIDAAIEDIRSVEGRDPILIATSARKSNDAPCISYFDQDIVWNLGRPVLILFGTGYGLAPELLARCDYILGPIKGLSNYNHLSVRSAVAAILDRWLGLNERSSKKLSTGLF